MIARTTTEEGSLDGTPPGDYLGGQMESTAGSTGRDWKGTGDDGSR